MFKAIPLLENSGTATWRLPVPIGRATQAKPPEEPVLLPPGTDIEDIERLVRNLSED
jgi:hypothetical protein